MKAWLLTGINEPLRLVERDDPRPGPGEVVVDVRAAGICHSDVGFIDGTLTQMLPGLPMVLGHEVAGTISDVGPNVEGFARGDRVALGGAEKYAPGWAIDGGFADKCLAHVTGLIRVPDSVAFAQAATATDAGQTSYGAVVDTAAVRAGERVGIIGLGGLGMTGARIAALAGAQVYAAEPKRDVWSAARERGVIEVVDNADALAAFDLDVVIDFAGFGITTASAINVVRVGGRVVQVGLGQAEATIPTAALVYKEVTLRGSRGGHPGALNAVIDQMSTGDLSIDVVAVGFDEIPDAIERLKNGAVQGRFVAVMG